ncbi:MAG TPA: NAD(P)-dependent oxidoreductase [Haliangiales bacterium]|nr:NAD(P)-dependent oxidoreductase [Haliangiales bacterium]
MNIVFCGTGWLPLVDAIRARLPAGASIRVRHFARPLLDELRDANVILPSNSRIDASAVAAPRDLRLIQQPAVGYEGVDLDAARARGVPVCNAPAANSAAVAETALFLLIAAAKRLPAARRAFGEAHIGVPVGTELDGKTLGLIGRGRSGSRVAAAAEALGMRVASVRSTSTRAEFLALLARSDFVSIHCPLGAATRGMFDDAAFAAMKAGAILVNCSRGAIVDRAALERALPRLGGVGLDTFWDEPWDPDDPLYARDDVVVLPHLGGSTQEAFGRLAAIVADNVGRIMRGEAPLYRVA